MAARPALRIPISLALIAATAALPHLNADARGIRDKILNQQNAVHSTQEQLRRRKAQLHQAQARVGDLRTQLHQTAAAIGQVSSRLTEIGTQIGSIERQVSWQRIQLAAANASLKRHDAAYKRRLVQIYEHGDTGYLDVLLSARSFSDFVERWDDLRLIVAADQRAVKERRAAAKQVAAAEARLERAQMSLQQNQQAAVQARSQLAALSDERRQLLQVADAQRQRVATEVAQLEELSAQEEQALQALIIQRQREIEAQREAERRAQRLAGHPASTTVATGSGALMWPVSGPITSPFGWRMHPIHHRMILHEGMDIAADTGTPIKAADAGRVIVAGWTGGYGNYINIDHGGGVSTGYGHCSAIYVSVGQDVKKGQVIGAVGSTGYSTGPHLHFEVRINGQPVDPATRL
ncbi:MAG: peptidoglycan DD-metalloendopeptidase family protein [Vulcanimicrobiaceae bacterium]